MSLNKETIKNNFLDFDEKSNKWILTFKSWVKLIFWLEIIASVIFGFLDGIAEEFIGYELGVLAIPIWILIGISVAFFNKTVNMLILQFLSNINTIRENLDKKE